jgi:deoxyribodipyrimidine photolyase-related protein
MNKSALLILGNQLFNPLIIRRDIKADNVIIIEDQGLCTHFKYHKHKIVFFLAAMREFRDELRQNEFNVFYNKLDENINSSYEDKLLKIITVQKIKVLAVYEIEDKFFENRIIDFCQRNNIQLQVLQSPMFLCSRERFNDYLAKTGKPFMRTFYQSQRIHHKILIDSKNNPIGGKWSYDTENRKKLPKSELPPNIIFSYRSEIVKEVIALVDKIFADHPGNSSDYWIPVRRGEAKKWLTNFISKRLDKFGPYEDAISKRSDTIYHSLLSPFINIGLLTPAEIVEQVVEYYEQGKIPIQSAEGFIRQVIGWREFIRGVYQQYSEKFEAGNYFNHHNLLSAGWYQANTKIEILDYVLNKVLRLAYAHHIERLMVLSNIMLLCEIKPQEVYRWFMEMFVDSSDWVMAPNVYGMGQFSEAGIFATKPYICGSNYLLKMSDFDSGEWTKGLDGMYWMFIEKNRQVFAANPRMSMMVKLLDKMDNKKKMLIYQAADRLKQNLIA